MANGCQGQDEGYSLLGYQGLGAGCKMKMSTRVGEWMKISGSESEKEDEEISDRKGREKCVFESRQMRNHL